MSTCTSSITIEERGSGICLTTRITSSTLVLREGGSLPLRLADPRFKNLGGRYHFRWRRLLRLLRRASIFSLTSRRCLISPAKRICPLPTQEKPVTWLPLSRPSVTCWVCSSHSQSNWIVNGLSFATLALPARKSLRALAGLHGISLCPLQLMTYTSVDMLALSPPFGSKLPLAAVQRACHAMITDRAFAYP